MNPIRGSVGTVGGHLYITLERVFGGNVLWGYRGGPGGNRGKPVRGCDLTKKKYGQLLTEHAEYKKGFVDFVPRNKENCKKITVNAFPVCGVIHRCFINTLARINKCCIEYKPVPPPFGIGGCNSNCVVGWLLKSCIRTRFLVAFIPLPVGKITPGIHTPLPRCLRQQVKPAPRPRRRISSICDDKIS